MLCYVFLLHYVLWTQPHKHSREAPHIAEVLLRCCKGLAALAAATRAAPLGVRPLWSELAYPSSGDLEGGVYWHSMVCTMAQAQQLAKQLLELVAFRQSLRTWIQPQWWNCGA